MRWFPVLFSINRNSSMSIYNRRKRGEPNELLIHFLVDGGLSLLLTHWCGVWTVYMALIRRLNCLWLNKYRGVCNARHPVTSPIFIHKHSWESLRHELRYFHINISYYSDHLLLVQCSSAVIREEKYSWSVEVTFIHTILSIQRRSCQWFKYFGHISS